MEEFLNVLKNIWYKIAPVFNKIHWIFWFIWLAGGLLAFGFIFANPQSQQNILNKIQQNVDAISQQYGKNLPLSTTEHSIPLSIATMKFTSPAFEPNGSIPSQYTCDGQGMSPPLQIGDAPPAAKSLVLIVHDPDAPIAGGFTHWVMWNIPPQTTAIAENTVPAGAVQGQNGAGGNKWTAPCPPSGTHHYQFMLYALDAQLDLPKTTNKDGLEEAVLEHIIGQAMLTGLYQKK